MMAGVVAAISVKAFPLAWCLLTAFPSPYLALSGAFGAEPAEGMPQMHLPDTKINRIPDPSAHP